MYYSRDNSGSINGQFARPQTSLVVEKLPDDHPDVVAFLLPPPPAITTAEILAALDEMAAALPPASRTQLDALLARP